MRRPVMAMMKVACACAIVTSIATTTQAQRQAPQTKADTAVATEIEHRLAQDPEVNAQNVRIDVRDGVVTLTGRVPGSDAKERAETVAARVPGVAKVQNEIATGGGGLRGDGGPGPIPDEMPGAH